MTNCGHELYGGNSVCPFCGSNVGGFSFGAGGSFSGTGGFGNTPQGQGDLALTAAQALIQALTRALVKVFTALRHRKNTGLIILICTICAAVVLVGAIAVGLALGNSDAAYQSYRMIWQDYNTAIILVTWR